MSSRHAAPTVPKKINATEYNRLIVRNFQEALYLHKLYNIRIITSKYKLITIIINRNSYRYYLTAVILDLLLLCLTSASLVLADVIAIDLVIDMKIVEYPLLRADLVVVLLIECLVDIVVVSEMGCRSCIP